MVYDLHTLQNRFYLHGNAIASLQTTIPLLKERLKSTKVNCIAFPDDGARKRFGDLFGDTGMDIGVCGKTRGEGEGERNVMIQEGDARGKNIVIVDDLVQTGGTLFECGKVLKAAGATEVNAFVAHAVFPKKSWTRFAKGGDRSVFAKFWVSNSVPTVTNDLLLLNNDDGEDNIFEVLDIMDAVVKDLDRFDSL
jgi:phosphoribosylpyrophosphate synthetase